MDEAKSLVASLLGVSPVGGGAVLELAQSMHWASHTDEAAQEPLADGIEPFTKHRFKYAVSCIFLHLQ